MNGMCLLFAHAIHYPRTPPCKTRKNHSNADRQGEWQQLEVGSHQVDMVLDGGCFGLDLRVDDSLASMVLFAYGVLAWTDMRYRSE